MKFRRIVILISIYSSLLIGVSFGGCKFITTHDAENVLNAYTSVNSNYKYYTFKAKVKEFRYLNVSRYDNERYFSFDVDYEYFKEKYGDDEFATLDGVKRWEASYHAFNKREFDIIPNNYRVLAENGGYDLLVEGKEVIISANNYYGWNGWEYPILSLEIDGTSYLDFEIGKNNFLKYVRAGFKDT